MSLKIILNKIIEIHIKFLVVRIVIRNSKIELGFRTLFLFGYMIRLEFSTSVVLNFTGSAKKKSQILKHLQLRN